MVARLTPPPDGTDRLSPESVFSKVAELGSFRRAALVLGLPAAVVSGTVRALERRRGRPLLARTGGSLAVLPEGAALLRALHGDPPAEDPHDASAPATCALHVDVCASQSRLLIQALPLFSARHPELRVHLYSGLRASVGSCDAVLQLGNPCSPETRSEVLGTYRIVTCASPGYLSLRGVPNSLEGLLGHRCIPSESDPVAGARPLRFLSDGLPREVRLEHVIAAADLATQLAAAVAGLGIAQVPLTREVRGQLAQRRLLPILEAYEPDGIPIVLGRRSDASGFTPFRDWLVDLYRSECLALSPRR